MSRQVRRERSWRLASVSGLDEQPDERGLYNVVGETWSARCNRDDIRAAETWVASDRCWVARVGISEGAEDETDETDEADEAREEGGGRGGGGGGGDGGGGG